MSTLSPDELVRLWAEEQLAPERAIGQLLQHVAAMQHALNRQAQTLEQLRAERAAVASIGVKATSTSARGRIRR